jgi:hypothetical protein
MHSYSVRTVIMCCVAPGLVVNQLPSAARLPVSHAGSTQVCHERRNLWSRGLVSYIVDFDQDVA